MQQMQGHIGREGKAGSFPSIRAQSLPITSKTGDWPWHLPIPALSAPLWDALVLLVVAVVLSDQLGTQHPIWPQRDKAGQLGGRAGGILSKTLGMAAPLPLNAACASSFLSLSRFIYNSGWIFLIITMISPAEL